MKLFKLLFLKRKWGLFEAKKNKFKQLLYDILASQLKINK
jgi:hypothetical protein